MTIRFCSRCATDVEDAGGFCLLGHRLALDPPAGTMEDLRNEIDRAFEEARLEVAAIMTKDDEPTEPMRVVTPRPAADEGVASGERPSSTDADRSPNPAGAVRRVGPPPPPPRRAPARPDDASGPSSKAAPATPAPSTKQVAPPPAPPSVPTRAPSGGGNGSVWRELDGDVDIAGDPIGAFAPPPHMDWGPDKGKVLKRKPARRARRTVDAAE